MLRKRTQAIGTFSTVICLALLLAGYAPPSWFKPSNQDPNLPAVAGEGLTISVEVVTKFQRALPIRAGQRCLKPLP
jgi:hypothetical protein